MTKNLNIKDHATVILTDCGMKIIDEHRQKIEKNTNLKFDFTLSYDENGKYTTELWHLMFLFGKHMTMTSPQVFKDNKIQIE